MGEEVGVGDAEDEDGGEDDAVQCAEALGALREGRGGGPVGDADALGLPSAQGAAGESPTGGGGAGGGGLGLGDGVDALEAGALAGRTTGLRPRGRSGSVGVHGLLGAVRLGQQPLPAHERPCLQPQPGAPTPPNTCSARAKLDG